LMQFELISGKISIAISDNSRAEIFFIKG